MSQNPSTKDYIMILENSICKKCGAQYKYICNLCQINDMKVNLTSKNRYIDDFVQEIQSKINKSNDIIFERIPYNQFYNIDKIGKDLNVAIWKNGPLHYDKNTGKFIRMSYKKVALKYFYNTPQDMIKLDEVRYILHNDIVYI
jgi:DNA modification methylase